MNNNNFDESKHPRGQDGKFIDKNGGEQLGYSKSDIKPNNSLTKDNNDIPNEPTNNSYNSLGNKQYKHISGDISTEKKKKVKYLPTTVVK